MENIEKYLYHGTDGHYVEFTDSEIDIFSSILKEQIILNINGLLERNLIRFPKSKSNNEFDTVSVAFHKNNNQLCWYSDMYGDIEDELVTEKCSRLIINLENDIFKIWAEKPIDNKCGITRVFHCITFSPGGNGQMAKNIKTGCNFQDEIVIKLLKIII